MKILICGAHGRMGQLVLNLAGEYGCEVVGKICRDSNFEDELLSAPDICIDFSSADGLMKLCEIAPMCCKNTRIISGTTGLSDVQRDNLTASARKIPILHATNFSIGAHVLNRLVRMAAKSFPQSFDVEIIERHHSKKKDAPSGTAMSLLKNIQAERPCVEIFGRHGNCVRESGEVCLHSIRGGDIVGEHEVLFAGQGERLELVHRATHREIFARGVLHVAQKFVNFNEPGLYTLYDVL
jgi:4-hydroxy-tetrahydrodipicolinate reductase